MPSWNGAGAIQWEHVRTWDLAAGASQFCRAEGALVTPGGFRSLSVFFRRDSASANVTAVELHLWTAPVFYDPLDTDLSNAADDYLLNLTLEPAGALQMTGTDKKVFGGRIQDNQPVGCLLFWELKNTSASTVSVVGDIYIVANHIGVVSSPPIERTVSTGGGRRPSAPNIAGLSGR